MNQAQCNPSDWVRVSRDHPCPICDHRDWCLVAADGSAAICPRVDDGAIRYIEGSGWLHRLDNRPGRRPPWPRRVIVRPAAPALDRPDLAELAEQFRRAVDPGRLDRLARDLGLSAEGLRRLGIGWCESSRAWSFPMVDTAGRVLGIRLRTDSGVKFAVKGGRDGLIVPSGLDATGLLLICEGPTDTAAMLDLGFQAVGRPSCSGGSALLVELVRRLRPAEVVVVADNDLHGRGLDGACALVQRLVIHCRKLRIIAPPPGIKDARKWKQAGATREVALDVIRAAAVHRVSVRVQAPRSPAPAGGGRHVIG